MSQDLQALETCYHLQKIYELRIAECEIDADVRNLLRLRDRAAETRTAGPRYQPTA
jgi:hypothetical protein